MSQEGKGKRKDLSKSREGTIVVSQDPSSADKDNQGGSGSFLSPGAVLWLCGTEQHRKGTAARLFTEMLTFVTSVGTAGTQDFHPLFKYPPPNNSER